jgi:CheY-like chemotaxis protein
MPDLNGAQVARKMRAANPQIPIVMLSGQPVRPPDVDGEVDAFLSKAGGPKLLLQEIERLLSTKKPPSGYPNESNIRKFG